MNHNGKVAIAPCGHTGETIIGNYVRCLVGCEGAPLMPKRGVPGHVDNCACKPCQFRRITTHIVLRDRNGKNWMQIEWDGIADAIEVDGKKSGEIRAFLFLDKDGNTVAKGMIEASLVPGKFVIKPKFMIDGLVMNQVTRGCVWQSMEAKLDYAWGLLGNYGYGVPSVPQAPTPVPATPTPVGTTHPTGTTINVTKPKMVSYPMGYTPPVVKGP